MRMKPVVAILALGALAGAAFAQGQRKFDWLPANDETATLDPANYYSGRTYHPGADGGNLHVDIKAQQPVTIFMVSAEEWSGAMQHPEVLANLHEVCPRTHVTTTTYTCFIPGEPMTLVIQDERPSTGKAVFAGIDAALNTTPTAVSRIAGAGLSSMLSGGTPAKKHYTAPNDVHVQYYRWDCVVNCVQPEYQWVRIVGEKYKLTPLPKVYGGYTPDFDGEQVSIIIKAPVPMVVTVLPSSIADQVYSNPQILDSALQKNPCQQRGVQKLQFQCTFNAADGPQSLVVAPEDNSRVPHKNTEVTWFANKCVEHCEVLPPNQTPAQTQQK